METNARERQRKDRDRRAQERDERQMQRELDERRMDLERLRESLDREIKDRTARQIQRDLTLDLGPDRFETLDGTDTEAYMQPSDPVERLSFWETPVTSKVSIPTPSFLRMPEESLPTAPKSILKKRFSTPAYKQIVDREDEESLPDNTQAKVRYENRPIFPEQIVRHSTPRVFGDRRDTISFQEQKAFGDRRDTISFQEQKEFGDRRDRTAFQEQKPFVDSFSFQEQKVNIPIARTVIQDIDSLPGQDITILEAGSLQEAEEDEYDDSQIMNRIKALQSQAEQIARRSQERISEESQLKEKIRMMDARRTQFNNQIERQNKFLLMKQEEEKLERQLEQRRDEEVKQKQRLDMLYKQEALLKREMEEDERQLRLRCGKEIYPELTTLPQLKTGERSQDRLGNEFFSERQMESQPDTDAKKQYELETDSYSVQKRELDPEQKGTIEFDKENKTEPLQTV